MSETLNSKPNILVSGSSGGDYIYNEGQNVTIEGKGGNDTIVGSMYGELIRYASGDGNDLITSFGENDTLQITSGRIASKRASGNDLLVTITGSGGTGALTLKGAANYELLESDTLICVDSVQTTLVSKNNVTINGGDGRDSIVSTGSSVTLNGGKGDDTLTGSDYYGDVFVFNANGGRDLITNFRANDTLRVVSGSIASSARSADDNDWFVTVKSSSTSGVVTLKGAGNYSFATNSAKNYMRSNDITIIDEDKYDASIIGTDRADSIMSSGANVTIEGKAGNDTIIGSAHGEMILFGSDGGQDVVTNFGANDTIKITAGSVQAMSESGSDFVIYVQGAKYAGTITLAGAAGLNFKRSGNFITADDPNANRIVNRNGPSLVSGSSGADYISNSGSNVTIEGKGGDDTIDGSNFGEVFKFAYNHGDDVILNFGDEDTLCIADSESYSMTTLGSDLVVTAALGKKSGKVTLKGAADKKFDIKNDGTATIFSIDYVNVIDNSDNKQHLVGKSGKDEIYNTGADVTIEGGTGNDTVYASAGNGELFLFGASDGHDLIKNFGSNDSLEITSGTLQTVRTVGNDAIVSVKSSNDSATITLGGAGKYKFIQNGNSWYVDRVFTFENYTRRTLIGGSEGRDSIVNHAESVSIDGGGGNDTIKGSDFGEVFLFGAIGGNDLIQNFGADDTLALKGGSIASHSSSGSNYVVTVKSGSQAGRITLGGAAGIPIRVRLVDGSIQTLNIGSGETIDNPTANQTLNGSAFNDSIKNSGASVKIFGGDGDDTIQTSGNNVSVDGGAGADSIRSTGGSKVTLHGGEGNDTLTGSTGSEVFQFRSDGGADVITNFGANDTLHIAAGKLNSYYSSGNDLIVHAKGTSYQGYVTLKGAASTAIRVKVGTGAIQTINGGVNRSNSVASVAFNGSAFNDTLNNTGRYVTLHSGDGNDSIYNYARGVSIEASGGNDTVQTFGQSVKVNGGSGNDSLRSTGGSNVTLHGGAGNDTLTGSSGYGEIFLFRADGGNDVITNFDASDTLYIGSGALGTLYSSGEDVIVSATTSSSTGYITLKGAASDPIKLKVGSSAVKTVIDNRTRSAAINGTSANDSIYNYARGVSIEASGGNDTVQTFGQSVKVNGGSGNDSIKSTGGAYVTLHGGAGNDTLTGSSGYGEIFLFRADGDNDVIINFDASDTLYIGSGAIGTFYSSGEDVIVSATTSSSTGYITLKGAASDPIKLKVGSNAVKTVIDNRTRNAAINGTSANDSIYNYARGVSIEASGGNDTVQTFGQSVKVNGGSGNDSLRSTGGAYVTLHGGAGNDTLTGSSGYGEIFLFRADGGSDVITNFDANDTLYIGSGAIGTLYSSGEDVIVSATTSSSTGYITLKGAASDPIKLKVGSNAVKTVIDNRTRNAAINGTSANDSIYNYARGVSIEASGGNDTVQTFGQSVKVNGGSGNDSLRSTGGANVTLHGGAGNDTLTGSSGYGEIFLFRADGDNDVITNFDASDTLYIGSGAIGTLYSSGEDVIVSATTSSSTGYITLKGAASDPIKLKVGSNAVKTVIDNRTRNKTIVGSSGADSIYNYARNVTIQSGDGNDTVETYGHSTSVFGGNGADSIKSRSGSNVTLHGGNGNDTLTGSSGAEVFQYRSDGGADLITNFDSNDTLHIAAGALGTYNASGNDLIVQAKGTSYTGTITLKGAASQAVKVKVGSGSIQTINASTGANYNQIINRNNNALVSGTSSRDHIINAGEHVTIASGAGNDTIEGSNYGEMFLFSSADGNNLITNFGANDTLRMTAGKTLTFATVGADVIVTLKGTSYTGIETLKGAAGLNFQKSGSNILRVVSSGSTVDNSTASIKLTGTAYADSIQNDADYVTIDAGGGNDTIYNGSSYGQYVTINAGAGADYIYGDVDNSTIRGGAGNDTIDDYDGRNVIQFGSSDGCDRVLSFYEDDTLHIYSGSITSHYASGSNYVVQVGSNAAITLGNAADVPIKVKVGSGSIQTINASTGANYTINNTQSNRMITGSSGADYIINAGEHVTIASGAGNDTIEGSNYGELFDFSSADGNNLITNFGANDTLRMTAGKTLTFATVGADVIVTLKGTSYTGIETLKGAAGLNFQKSGSNILRVGGVGETIYNSTASIKLTGTAYADSIQNSADYVMIDAGGGNDTIYNGSSYSRYVSINAGSGNDYIYGDVDYSTIRGGAGNDTIDDYDGRNVIQFGSSDGCDRVLSFYEDDTLHIYSGSITSHYASGSDYVVQVGSSAAITLGNAADVPIQVKVGSASIQTLNASTGANYNQIYNDNDNVKVNGSDSADFIINTGEHVTIQSNAGSDTIVGSDYGELYLFSSADGNNVITNFGANDTIRITAGSIQSMVISGSNYVVEVKGTSYSGTITLLDAAELNFKKSGNYLTADAVNTIANTLDNVKVSGTDSRDYIINNGENVTIQANGGDDTVECSDYGEVISYASGDGNDIINNFDSDDTLKITDGSNYDTLKSGNDLIVYVDSGSITFRDTGSANITGGTYVFKGLRQLSASNEDYWFLEDRALDEIDQILSSENNFVGLEFDSNDRFKPSEIELVSSARSRFKK